MVIRVRLFAALRERAGSASVDLELPEGAKVSDALAHLASVTAGVPVVMAVNREYAAPGDRLSAGDEVALIPPVSGGEGARGYARVRDTVLSLDALLARVRHPSAGAIVTFSGTTRAVPELRYEAYVEMAQAKMRQVVDTAVAEHGLCAAAAEHRVGRVPLCESSVLVAASAPHRAEAFAGARQIIDEIKARVPIWKQECGEWVTGTTPA